MHLNNGQLRAALDHELEPNAAEHLATCRECLRRADEMAEQSKRVDAHLAVLSASSDHVLSAPVALSRFKTQRVSVTKEIPMFKKIFSRRYRAAWAMIAIAALLAVSMTFPPVRAWAEGVLAQFRVSKISVVTVNTDILSQLGNGTDLSKQISQMLSDSVTVLKKPQASRAAANAADATKLAGFQVRLPTSRSDTPRLFVQDSGAFQFVVNRARAQSLLDQAGANGLKLPASIDGAIIKVSIPAGVIAGYGDCPNLDEGVDATNSNGSPGRTMNNCIVLTQIPSPSVDAPPDLDIQQLAELGLQFGGMTKDQAHAYASTVDWTSTLVVPIPRNAAQHKPVSVDGVNGYLIERAVDHSQYALVWVKNGIIYAIGGFGDGTAALAMANSLR
jgi:hypothetical protein